MKLLTIENAKTTKGEALGYLTGILYLAPSDLSGFNVCSMALRTNEAPNGVKSACSRVCLNTAGMGAFSNVQAARIAKTRRYFEDREQFMLDLASDVRALCKRAAKLGMLPAVRLDGTSDLGLAGDLAPMFPDVRFYDYTKVKTRVFIPRNREIHNWSVVYSANECTTDTDIRFIAGNGVNVSVVFDARKGDALPAEYLGLPVVDGDDHDLRFLDPVGVIVGLRAKGKARKGDEAGFVRRVIPIAQA